jgi:hypothetical protein
MAMYAAATVVERSWMFLVVRAIRLLAASVGFLAVVSPGVTLLAREVLAVLGAVALRGSSHGERAAVGAA